MIICLNIVKYELYIIVHYKKVKTWTEVSKPQNEGMFIISNIIIHNIG